MRISDYFISIFFLLSFSGCKVKNEKIIIDNLRCEYHQNPIGIDERDPRLSWIINNDQRGEKQKAYQIIVSSTSDLLNEDQGDLWNSGKIKSDQSVQVDYAGKQLESRMNCFWKVRIWDKDGNPTNWSKPALWSMGLLKKGDWQAKWIGSEDSTSSKSSCILTKKAKDASSLPARMLRHEFNLIKKVKRATTYVCGLGFFELYVNGKKVEDHLMDPGLTDYNKVALYVTFDVTAYLKDDKNCMGIILGNGRFFPPRKGNPTPTVYYGLPRLLLQMEIEFEDGSKQTIVSDESWKITTDGPILENSEYDGEVYDARKEMEGWCILEFDDSSWKNAQIVQGPKGALASQMLEPMRITERIKPVSVSKSKNGTFIVDMGQNFYGMVQLKVSGPAGAKVEMEGAYSLRKDGSLKTEDNRTAVSTDVYVLKGKGKEIWSPRFRGQGYRRIKVTGFPGVPTIDNFSGLVVNSDVKPTGSFECSSELINRIHKNMCYGMRTFMRSAPLDPDRDERQPWLGDPAKDAESEGFNFNVSPFYSKWMRDINYSQRADSTIPDVSMYWTLGNGIEWQSVFTIVPDWIQNFYSDKRVLEYNYKSMKKWVLAMERYSLADHTSRGTSYGDWCDSYSMDKTGFDMGKTSHSLISTAYHYHDCRIITRAAKMIGKTDDEKLFSKLAARIKEGFNNRFLMSDTSYESGTQCSYILPLAFDMVPPQYRNKIISNLCDDILRNCNGHLSVGLIGMQWMMQVLSDADKSDVAWTLVNQTTRPSWGYMINQGATTIWERWDTDTRDPGMNSENLLILAGNLDAWFYQTLAGINYDVENPGFKHIIMKPTPIGDLKWAKASHESMYGTIKSEWNVKDQEFDWNISIPANTDATIYVPAENENSVSENGNSAIKTDGFKFIKMENWKAVFNVGAGNYLIKSKIKKIEKKSARYVQMPKITPSDTTIVSPGIANVKLTCPTEGAEIHFTLDGSIPSNKSPIYKEFFVVDKSTIVRAIAYKSGYECSGKSQSTIDIYDPKVNGWNYSYYEGNWIKLPDFKSLKSIKKGKTSDINPSKIEIHNYYYAIEYDAFIDITKEDEYTFYITSDDGSKLFIDRKLVLDDDGIHGPYDVFGKIKLSTGKHKIRIEYFQGNYGAVLSLMYESQNILKQKVPVSRIYYSSMN